MSHTPGPWNFHPYYNPFPGEVCHVDDGGFDCLTIEIAKGETLLAEVGWNNSSNGGFPSATTVEEARANARLIVKAPELLAALDRVWKWADNHADIKDNGEANDAMWVKDMIEDELGDDFVYSHWRPNALTPAKAGGAA